MSDTFTCAACSMIFFRERMPRPSADETGMIHVCGECYKEMMRQSLTESWPWDWTWETAT